MKGANEHIPNYNKILCSLISPKNDTRHLSSEMISSLLR